MEPYDLHMTESITEEVVTAWARLMKAQRQLLGAVEADLKAAGLPPLGWYDALLELRRAAPNGLRPLELEDRLLLAQHNVSRLIDRLEAAGFAARCPCASDGRGQIVAITEAGRDLTGRMWPVYRAAIERHMGARLSPEEASRLADVLGKLVAAAPA
jgi:DNA-binding MarR family transcriptional regulator